MDVKAKYLLLEIRMLDEETVFLRLGPRRRSVQHGDDFNWLGGHSANQEALEVSWWGSWLFCAPSLEPQVALFYSFIYTYIKLYFLFVAVSMDPIITFFDLRILIGELGRTSKMF